MSYTTERDDLGDDVLVFVEGTCRLPRNYRSREVAIAARNIREGHDRRDLAISRNVLHLAVQAVRWGLVLALGVLVGCAPPAPRIAVAQGFSGDELRQIQTAADTWNAVVRVDRRIALNGGEWTLLHETPPGHAAHGWIGETSHQDMKVYIWPEIDPSLFYRTVLHELGHTLGLHHVQGKAVMNASANSDVLTDADMEECKTEGVCPLTAEDYEKCRMQGACGEFPGGNP